MSKKELIGVLFDSLQYARTIAKLARFFSSFFFFTSVFNFLFRWSINLASFELG